MTLETIARVITTVVAPFKPSVKTFLPDGNELPSLRIFCSLAMHGLLVAEPGPTQRE